jgi:peroxiredoxin Q/BCP
MKLSIITSLGVLALGCGTTAPSNMHSRSADVTACGARLARLAEGELAPDFVGRGHDGAMVALSALRSRTVILHFYPAGATPSAVQAATKLRAAWPEIDRPGVVLVGVSRGVVEGIEPSGSQAAFALVADPDGAVSRAYGWAAPYDDADRRTFVIGPDGTIQKIYCVPSS